MADGTVREWYDDEGWGVLDSDATPGGCFAHFSSVQLDGYRRLTSGEPVRFVWIREDRDDFSYRAERVSRAAVDPFPPTPAPDPGPLVETGPGWRAVVPDPVGAEHDGLLAAAKARAAALVSGDPDNLTNLLHPDFTWTTHRGDVLDRAAYVRGNTDGSLTWLEQRLDTVRTTIVGDTGVLTCVVRDRVVRDGQELAFAMPLTQTWVREPHDWRCLAGHAGPALDA